MKIRQIISAILIGGLFSCEKEITLDLNTANKKFVIEGEITPNEKATVRIIKTVDFTQPNNFPSVRGANVRLSDGSGNTEQLVETGAGVYQSQKIVGAEGKTYSLTVIIEGSTFTAQTTMPTNIKLTGIKVQKSSFSPPGSTSDSYIIYPQFIDPAAFGNSYRFIQTRNGERDKSIIVANDNIGNGLPNSRPILSADFEIVLGDNVTLEMHCIDKPIYDYFFSLNSVQGNGPGGGTVPANPVTNIKGGALGYFSAHTLQRMSIEVK
ncbi:DUF4249 domain-containing protein [Runella slithyformis]|uniref:DUF4249 domain-containing protein n=1 Tax=Runella slithyformis (strain ATCC 29530 / DSM 19594 / LMG 11500 / NCIMB 11436 / LSU 4) TaxID=761193 RepID=A0A7U3ZRU2_RUNSL|nr:DUF4249 domain-containing protein [Runella slithyformis]AEI52204.1 hypothetical protein Runsl_5796 [Runella slithyformis DSM 19594]